jgi:hypothetical protein
LLGKHLRAPVPNPHAINSQLTPEFNSLVMRAMAKSRDERPSSMDEFLKIFRTMRVFKVKLKG